MGLLCGTSASFMSVTAAAVDANTARTAQATTITPELGLGLKMTTLQQNLILDHAIVQLLVQQLFSVHSYIDLA